MNDDLIYSIYFDNHYKNIYKLDQSKMTKPIWMRKFIWKAPNDHKEPIILKEWVYSLKI